MPDHVRKQLRAAAQAELLGLVTTGDNVFAGRTRPLGDSHPPTLLVYTRTETSGTEAAGNPATLARTVELVLVGRVQAADAADAEDLLDAIAAEVEAKLGANATLGLAKAIGLLRTETEMAAPGEHHIGAVIMTFAVLYHTREGAPATAV